jgi:spectinomycin phosphotransferase
VREPPRLATDRIAGALRAAYGIRVADLVFLPVGNDAASWAYRVEAPAGPWFLKVRAGPGPMPGAEVPALLARQGVPDVLAPLVTGAGEASVVLDGFRLALFPLLEAANGAEAGLSPGQWRRLGAAVRRLHALGPAPELAGTVGRETFRPVRPGLLAELEARLAAAPAGDPVARELAAAWRPRRAVIARLFERAEALGRQLAGRAFPRVLCHADLHPWNVLVDDGQRLWIVDWDEATLAPRDRDLMFVVGGGIGHGLIGPADTDRFLEGYGPARPDPDLLAYYRAAWAVRDIAEYGEQVLATRGLGEAGRRDAVAGFLDLFAPGNIVELARTPVGYRRIHLP